MLTKAIKKAIKSIMNKNVQGDGYETGCLLCYAISMGIIIW